MKFLEVTWSVGGELIIWGEKNEPWMGTEVLQELPESEGEASKLHPFSCSSEELSEALTLFDCTPDRSFGIELFLPSDWMGPLPSPKLPLAEDIERNADLQLSLWHLPAVSLAPVSALNFLTSLPTHLPPGLRLDDSVKFWREATKLLLELLTRGRFLPGILRKNGDWLSHWHILPSQKEDHERLTILAECMPPICRALAQSGQSKNPEPSFILESFISHCSDALVRSFLSRTSLLEGIARETLPARLAVEKDWLDSLTRPDATLPGPEYELAKFEQRLRSWAGDLLSAASPHQVHTCFRLLPPVSLTSDETGPDEVQWIVEFYLQSTTDSSQELMATQIWRGDLGFLKHSEFSLEDVEEILLKDLGKALTSFPELRRPLSEAYPTHVTLSTSEAYAFLQESAKRLEQQGFTVIVPQWWNQPSTRVGLHLTVNSETADLSQHVQFGFLASHHLLDYSWEIALGQRRIGIDEFRELVKTQAPLLEIDGKWVELQPERLQATLKFLERQSENDRLPFIDALRIGFGIDHNPSVLPVLGLSATGWIKQLLEADTHKLSVLAEPQGFCGTLRGYQREGLSWLMLLTSVGVGGCLADDMGLGKTIQLLALLLHERYLAREHVPPTELAPTLLIVPMSILVNWEHEANKFAPGLRIYVHHGPQRLDEDDFRARIKTTDVVITTYSLAHRDESLLNSIEWGRIALDEAQNIKNLEAKQTRAVRRLARQYRTDESSPVPHCHRLALTGTPLENHLEELWSIFDFLNPGFLGGATEFRRRFAIPVERFRNKEAAAQLSRLIQPFVLRRLKNNPEIIDDLPDKMEMEVFTTLTEEQAVLYQSILERMLPQVDAASGMHRKGLVLSTITRLKQICDHPALFLKDESPLAERSGKLSRLEEMLEVILAEGDKVLIFTQYAQMGHLLKPYLQERFDADVLFLHGALSRGARQSLIDKFQKPDGPSLFILSVKAGGFGLNLTEANQVIHFDQWWNPAVEEQATDRAHRIGQKRSVQVRKFVCKGTLEEKIHSMLQHKRDLADQVVGSTKNMVLQLSTDELRNLLQLNTYSTEGDTSDL